MIDARYPVSRLQWPCEEAVEPWEARSEVVLHREGAVMAEACSLARCRAAAVAESPTVEALDVSAWSMEDLASVLAARRAAGLAERIDAAGVLIARGLSVAGAAAVLGCSKTATYEAFTVSRAGPEIRQAVRAGQVTASHAMALMQEAAEADRPGLLRAVRQRKLSVRGLKRLIQQRAGGVAGAMAEGVAPADADVAVFERALGDVLGSEVRVAASEAGVQLALTCYGIEALQGLLERLAAGPAPESAELPGSSAGHRVTIALDSIDSLQALVGHLLPDL